MARLSVRLTFQSVIEEIVCEELGRDRYQRRTADSPEGDRNGWQQPRTLRASLGPVELQRPKRRHAHAALCDRLFGQGVTRTNALETLVISCWVRGLSDRDVEAMGRGLRPSRPRSAASTVSRICQRLRAEFDAWKRRDLTGVRIDYLDLDGSLFNMHPRPRPNRCWWPGASQPAASRCSAAWPRRSRVDRRLAGAADRPRAGRPAAGHLSTAARACARRSSAASQPACTSVAWSTSPQPHRQGPTHAQDQVKPDSWAIFDHIEQDGEAAVAEARRRAKRLITTWQPL